MKQKHPLKIFLSVFLSVISIIFSSVPTSAKNPLSTNEFCYKRNSENKIAITFDDGPHPIYTKKILNILEKYDIKATFFIIGSNVEHYGSVLRDIVSNGHEIGNHTFSHQCLNKKSDRDIEYEINSCREIIYKKCGEKTTLFRPPGGIMTESDNLTNDIFGEYNIIYWSIDTRDWAHLSPQIIADHVIKSTRSGDIILMHDYIGKNSPTPDALELFIPKLLEKGFKFVTISELIDSQ